MIQRSRRQFTLLGMMAVVGVCLLPGTAYARKLLPVDQAAQDPSFLAFRQRFVKAVQEKDHQYLVSALSPSVRIGFGDKDTGVRKFCAEWRPEQKDSKLWPTLQSLLALGGSFEDGEFTAPYVFSKFPEGVDSVDYRCIIGRDVNVRSGPSTTAPVVEKLRYDLVEMVYEEAVDGKPTNPDWEKIVTPSGKTGYVSKKLLRSAMDYRAAFAKVKGQWKLRLLVGGD